MLDAIDKLGLHIDHRKGAAEVLVVDQVDQTPTENSRICRQGPSEPI